MSVMQAAALVHSAMNRFDSWGERERWIRRQAGARAVKEALSMLKAAQYG